MSPAIAKQLRKAKGVLHRAEKVLRRADHHLSVSNDLLHRVQALLAKGREARAPECARQEGDTDTERAVPLLGQAKDSTVRPAKV
jgi:hypothetical protein